MPCWPAPRRRPTDDVGDPVYGDQPHQELLAGTLGMNVDREHPETRARRPGAWPGSLSRWASRLRLLERGLLVARRAPFAVLANVNGG